MGENIFDEVLQTELQPESLPADFGELRNSYFTKLRDKAIEMRNDVNFDLDEADIRFSTALNLRQVRNSLVAIIGGGGLGNWQWRILASMGFRRIAVFDDDTVGIENIGSQCHSIFELGNPKVAAIQRAALEYRGISLIGIDRRVGTLKDINDALGETPDIIIGCTDSAEFRKQFFLDFSNTRYPLENLPEIYLDYRMSLGDWAAFILPLRSVFRKCFSRTFLHWYATRAIFEPEEALTEACTERAISYTGANVASFTGAFLHWYYSGGRAKFGEDEFLNDFVFGQTFQPARFTSFSARDFEFISPTRAENVVRKQLAVAKGKLSGICTDILNALNFGFSQPEILGKVGDISDGILKGKFVLDLLDRKLGLVGMDRIFWYWGDSINGVSSIEDSELYANCLVIESNCTSINIGEVSGSERARLKFALLMNYTPGSIFTGYSLTIHSNVYIKTHYNGIMIYPHDGKCAMEDLSWFKVRDCIDAICELKVMDNIPPTVEALFEEKEEQKPTSLEDISVGDIITYHNAPYVVLDIKNHIIIGEYSGDKINVSKKFIDKIEITGKRISGDFDPDNFNGFYMNEDGLYCHGVNDNDYDLDDEYDDENWLEEYA